MTIQKRPIRVKHSRLSGSSLWGTAWRFEEGEFHVSWPTLYGSVPFGFFGLVFCAIATSVKSFELVTRNQEFGLWSPALITLGVVSSVCLLSSRLLRETFSLSTKCASRSRWPAILRPRQAAPRDQVLNAVVRLIITHGKTIRRTGYIHVRIRRTEGIEWWSIGRDLTWGKAQLLGRDLARFIDVKWQQDDN